ncbi:hypothetical protein PENTCL1PPCAC_23999, partial [Pristionchus entomophagus]
NQYLFVVVKNLIATDAAEILSLLHPLFELLNENTLKHTLSCLSHLSLHLIEKPIPLVALHLLHHFSLPKCESSRFTNHVGIMPDVFRDR